MTRKINLSNTQFRYQLVFFVLIYGYIWLAEGCLWHLLPRQVLVFNIPIIKFIHDLNNQSDSNTNM